MVDVQTLGNWIQGQAKATSGKFIDVYSPATGSVIAKCPISTKEDVDVAVEHAKTAFTAWSARTVKDRVQVLIRFHNLVTSKYASELADLIVLEHGKAKNEALAEVAKGIETCEYAMSAPQVISGNVLEVSRGVKCEEVRLPLGVCASIVPFNFPFMVPMWTLPMCIAAGNTLILKPSEKVPLTMFRTMEILKEAGLPDGVVQIVNGTVDAVQALTSHPSIQAVTFVGTSHVGKLISEQCHASGKRVLALGGAKNHLVAHYTCNADMASSDIVASFTGCTGQRCMAASVLLVVPENPSQKAEDINVVKLVCDKARAVQPGQTAGTMGPVIDQASLDRICKYIDEAEKSGVKVLVDGRNAWKSHPQCKEGYWIAPTVLLHSSPRDPAMKDEIFGPVISIYKCKDEDEAILIENGNPYGNAACIYTQRGDVAEWFTKRLQAGMVGVNIGVPVPREPFSFGGINLSKFGTHDITGDAGMEFFTYRKKITTKWAPPTEKTWLN